MKTTEPIDQTEVTDHLKLLLAGAAQWNAFRRDHPDFRPDFTDANLRNIDLSHCDLHAAKMCSCDFSGANLSDVNFAGADLRAAIMKDTTICDTDFSNVNYLALASIGGAKVTPKGALRELPKHFVHWALEYGASEWRLE